MKFACKVPTWRLPVDGHVLGLVTAHGGFDAEWSLSAAEASVSSETDLPDKAGSKPSGRSSTGTTSTGIYLSELQEDASASKTPRGCESIWVRLSTRCCAHANQHP